MIQLVTCRFVPPDDYSIEECEKLIFSLISWLMIHIETVLLVNNTKQMFILMELFE